MFVTLAVILLDEFRYFLCLVDGNFASLVVTVLYLVMPKMAPSYLFLCLSGE